jgi:hypothetical protein
LPGPAVTAAAAKKWLPVSQTTVSFVQVWAACLRPARAKK